MSHPQDQVFERFMAGVNAFTDDFMAEGREQEPHQEEEQRHSDFCVVSLHFEQHHRYDST